MEGLSKCLNGFLQKALDELRVGELDQSDSKRAVRIKAPRHGADGIHGICAEGRRKKAEPEQA